MNIETALFLTTTVYGAFLVLFIPVGIVYMAVLFFRRITGI